MTRAIALMVLSLQLVACRHGIERRPFDAQRNPDLAREAASHWSLYLEAEVGEGINWRLPASGVEIPCEAAPVAHGQHLQRIDVATLELGAGILIQMRPEAADVLAQRLRPGGTRRVVLVRDGAALGSVRLSRVPPQRQITMFLEVPESDLAAIASDFNRDQPTRR